MNIIEKDLRKMLLSSKEDEWNSCYQSIADKLQSDPAKLAKLDKIKSNPSYYAGYYLKKIRGHIEANGSVPAEQNHSSIVAYLDKGHSDWTIMAHAAALLKRQAYHSRERKRAEDKLYANGLRYKSSFTGQEGKDDEIAKKALSMYAYKNCSFRPSKQRIIIKPFLIIMEIVTYGLWALKEMMIIV